MEKRQLVIIGSGPAGLTAAIYGTRSGLDTLILESGLWGGQVNNTAEIENYPGIKTISGMDLATAMREHAEDLKAEFRNCEVESLFLDGDSKIVRTDKGDISADAVIIATGSTNRKAGFKGEDELAGRGVTYCAVCDGPMYQDASVAVIGGGNTAVEEADYLTQFASKVYIIHRREELRANNMATERALLNPKIEMLLGWVTEEISGQDAVQGVKIRNLKSGDRKEIAVEGVFVFVGTKPNVDFLKDDAVKRSPNGWIETDEMMETSVEGVFAAGDVRDKFLRQVVTAAGDGATAAMAAYDYISNQHFLKSALFEPERAVALLISSIEGDHLALAREAEDWAKSGGARIVTIDGHRNLRIKEKLGVRELPAIVEIRSGRKTREAKPSSVGDIKDFCRGLGA
ncbi:MAG: thioredoxin-disulfide reductase [Synergistaceae bacterium]|jgi:thioredoxin reductase (NADPH)|nr:thioredoxin-disulfide reductase [Synergistaceae bacterium]